MSVLALKAIDYGASNIPDSFFEKLPVAGKHFTPAEKREAKEKRNRKDKSRNKSEQRRSSRQNRSPSPSHSEYSGRDDTDYERERAQRKKNRRRRARSEGRDDTRDRGIDGDFNDPRNMAYAEQGGPYFPPPPGSDHRPYNPQEYAPQPAQGYPAQPAGADVSPPYSPTYGHQHRGSASAAKYTPGPGYAPSPLGNDAPLPPGANAPYVPYNPADYSSNRANYPSPPPLSRHRSNSQPSYGGGPVPTPAYPTYIPPSAEQRLTAYDDQPSSRRGSTKPRREHRHRARSADTRSSRDDRESNRESSRMAKVRERFDGMDMRERGLAATVGGALAGGLAGRQLGKSTLTTLAGVAAGALGGRAISDKKSRSRGDRPSRSRSRSRHRHHDRSPSRDRSRDRTPPRGLRARSRSIIDRFRSKSRGPEDRDSRKDRHDRPDRGYDRGNDDRYEYFSSESEGDGSPVNTRRHRKRRDY